VNLAGRVGNETYDGLAARLTGEVSAAYAAVYAEAPYRDGPAEVAEFAAEWPGLVTQPGFRLVLARAGSGEVVGFALGHQVEPASGWWTGLAPASAAADASFGVAELGVRSDWRRRGLASRLHEALLADRREPRVVLWVRADAPAAVATYARWGYRLLGWVADRPPYQVMCLDRAAGKTNTAPHANSPNTADDGTSVRPDTSQSVRRTAPPPYRP
jgi:GNAT superfamily N-acetyltransferase